MKFMPQPQPDNRRRLVRLAEQIELQHEMLFDLAKLSREQAAEIRNIAQNLAVQKD